MKELHDSLKLTVITIVYNAVDRIKSTMESVLGQDYDDIDYIIKDGGSDDGTLDIIREYAQKFSNIRFISESDSGIYDAMNVAVKMASGDVIHFLNAGDRFDSKTVVSRAMNVMAEKSSDIVYGDVLYENPDGTTDVRAYPQSCSSRLYYLTGDAINHQVMFARRSLFENNLFDTSFIICADREWMLRIGAYTPKRKMTALSFVIARYPLDGVSVINKELYKSEADACIKKYMPLGYPVYFIFEFFRSQKKLSKWLHELYKFLYYKN